MFTGIIQAVGVCVNLEPVGGDVRLRIGIEHKEFADLVLGESIAVSGVCLTVVDFDAQGFSADVSQQTLDNTSIGRWREGDTVNLERALQVQSRLGGHVLSGHVDGLATVVSITPDARSQRWRFALPNGLQKYIALKGSIAINGVSLTVTDIDADGFEVNLVPHTVANTQFSCLKVGDSVNIEVDVLARYAERLLQFYVPNPVAPQGTPP